MRGTKPGVEVDVWTIPLAEPRDLILSSEEEIRASRFRAEKHRLHWSRAHSALRQILAQCLQVEPLAIVFQVNRNGKPLVDGLHFNLSHTDEYAMIATSKQAAVGIDIECLRPGVDMARLLERLGETNLPEKPEELHQRWTQREAASKARGGALFDPPDPHVHAIDLQAPPDHFASLATVNRIPLVRYCGGVG